MSISGHNMIIALCLIQRLVAGIPLPAIDQCVDDNVLLSLQQGDVSSVCNDLIMTNQTTITQRETSTIFSSNSTVTSTSSFTPTLFFTLYKDFAVTVTSSASCINGEDSSGTTSAPTPPPRGGGRIEGRDLPLTSSISTLQRSQISSACKCLNVGGTTITKTATVTSLVPEVTQQYMVPAPHPVMAYITIGATNTATIISCLDGT